jgi:glycosyltransferase involved in cell wall biosynthesis
MLGCRFVERGRASLKVAVYSIALNEGAHAERWANSAADADYRIVADTGSVDDTVDRLVGVGVSVFRIAIRPWRFDQARNAAMALIPADVDVCLTMDMDEYLAPDWRPKLEAAWTPDTTALWCRKTLKHSVEAATELSSFSVKNFHQRWGYRFKRPVHEALSFSGDREVTRDCSDIVIYHVQDHGKSTRKQYLPMMELAHREDPNDAQICFWLGREYMWAAQNDAAIAMFESYLALPSSNWPDERSEAMRYLARLNRAEKRMLWLDRARVEAPHRREIWLDLAEELHGQGDWANLFWACLSGIEKTRPTGTYLDDRDCWGFRLYDLGAAAAGRLDVMDRARGWAEKAFDLGPPDQKPRLQADLDAFANQRATMGAEK